MKELFTQYQTIPNSYIESKILEFLTEDHAFNDLTTKFTMIQTQQKTTAHIIAEQNCVFVGSPIINNIFQDD